MKTGSTALRHFRHPRTVHIQALVLNLIQNDNNGFPITFSNEEWTLLVRSELDRQSTKRSDSRPRKSELNFKNDRLLKKDYAKHDLLVRRRLTNRNPKITKYNYFLKSF